MLLFGHWVVSDFLGPDGLQHARFPCPSLSPGICLESCPSSQQCCLIISSSAVPCSFFFQSLPAPGSFPMSQFFASGGHSIGASASPLVFPMNIQSLFPLRLMFGLLTVQGSESQESSPQPHLKIINYSCSPLFMIHLSHLYMTRKSHRFEYTDLCRQRLDWILSIQFSSVVSRSLQLHGL